MHECKTVTMTKIMARRRDSTSLTRPVSLNQHDITLYIYTYINNDMAVVIQKLVAHLGRLAIMGLVTSRVRELDIVGLPVVPAH